MRLALGAIRWVGVVVGVLSAAVGVGYSIVAVIGPDVWWAAGGSAASGAFVAFPLPLRIVGALAVLLRCALVSTVALLVAELVRRIRHGVRFDRAVSQTSWAIALALAGGATVVAWVANLGRYSALRIDGGIDPANPVGAPISWAPVDAVLVPDIALLGIALVLGVLAYIIGTGERLQRDVEGLV